MNKCLLLAVLSCVLFGCKQQQQNQIGRYVPQGSGLVDTVTGTVYKPAETGESNLSWRVMISPIQGDSTTSQEAAYTDSLAAKAASLKAERLALEAEQNHTSGFAPVAAAKERP